MGNCLVTKLKDVVNNDNLAKMGVLKLKNTGLSDFSINAYRTSGVVVSVTEGGKIYTSITDRTNDTNGVTEMSITGNTYLFFKSGTYDILISNKYNLWKLQISSGASMYLEDMRDVKYCTEMKQLTLKLLKNPDFTNLSKMSSLSALRFYPYTGFTGGGGDLANISTTITELFLINNITVSNTMHLTKCTGLTTLSLRAGLTVTDKCSIEDFIDGCVTNNRASGSMGITLARLMFTTFYAVNVEGISQNAYNTLEWDGTSKIIYKSGGTSYTDIKTIHEIGATAQEIADWKSSDITVIDASTGEPV